MAEAARHVTSRTPIASKLLVSAHDAIVEHGLLAVSARMIAGGAGTAPSAIHYHFGNVETLIGCALAEARERDRAWRRRLIDELAPLRLTRESFALFFQGVVTAAGYKHRELTLLRWDVALAAILQKRTIDTARAWRDDLTEFWEASLRLFGIESPPQPVAEFADAVSRLFLAAGDGPTHVAWVLQTVMYFAERLSGESSTEPIGRMWRDLHRNVQVDTTEHASGSTAARIVEGALKIVLTQGPHALTHRTVARAAHVSLSSTTYHFRSRGEILHAAFSQLRARTLARIAGLTTAKQGKALSIDELIELMGTTLVPNSREVSREYVAGQSLLHAAARDPQLRRHAEQLYATTGEATLALFARTDDLRRTCNAFAAFTFALATDAMLCNAGLECPSTVAMHVRNRQRAMIALLCDT